MPDVYRRFLVTVDASVIQTTCTTDVAIVTDAHILDRTGIEYHYMVADSYLQQKHAYWNRNP